MGLRQIVPCPFPQPAKAVRGTTSHPRAAPWAASGNLLPHSAAEIFSLAFSGPHGTFRVLNRRSFLLASSGFLAGLVPSVGAPDLQTGREVSRFETDPEFLKVPSSRKTAWESWIETSRRLRAQEIALMEAELKKARRREAKPAKKADSFRSPGKSDAWFASREARRTADHLLTWQAPSGGWSKNTAMTKKDRARGQRWSPHSGWDYVGTIDNHASTSQITFLGKVAAATGRKDCQEAVERGLRWLLLAQMPSGGWPQVYPLQGKYHDLITFNDDAMVHVLDLLRAVKNRHQPWKFVSGDLRDDIETALQQGIGCVLACQVRVNGKLTAWCAQHHPVTLAPAAGRSYELVSLSGQETVPILRFLMSLGNPARDVRDSVQAAVSWLRRSEVDPAALGRMGTRGARWARFYEIPTNRPLFSDTDGRVRYSFSEVREKRKSYAWFTDAPAALLSRDYPKWRRRVS